MPFCKKCGRGLPLDADFCSNCGTKVEGRERTYEQQNNGYNNNGYNNNGYNNNGYNNNGYNANYNSNSDYQTYQEPPRDRGDGGAARRQNTLDHFYLRLKWERIAWSIASKVFIILGAVLLTISLIIFIIGIANGIGYVSFFLPFWYSFYGVSIAGIGVVNYIMVGKVQRYMDGLYHNCEPAVTRGESVGMIIFCYFFNTVALVFYLINFIQIKCNREDFEEIRRLQMNSNHGNGYWQ